MSVLAERRLGAEPEGTSMASLGVCCRTDRRHFGCLVLDLSAVTGADPAGLTVLVGTGRRVSFLGGLLLAAPAAEFSDLLASTGLDRHFCVYPSVDAAIRSTGPR